MVTYYPTRFYTPLGPGYFFMPMGYVEVGAPVPQPVGEEVGAVAGRGRGRYRSVLGSPSPRSYGREGFLDAFDKVRGRLGKRKPKEYVDPLEVLRDKAKTEERVKKSELRALRKEVAELSREKEALRAERSPALEDALRRISGLEAEVARLGKMLAALSTVPVHDPRFSLRGPPSGRRAKGPAVSERPAPLAAPAAPPAPSPEAPPDAAARVRAGLPFWLGAALAALGTYWLVPPKERALKFAGYAVAAVAAAAGLWSCLAPSDAGRPAASPRDAAGAPEALKGGA